MTYSILTGTRHLQSALEVIVALALILALLAPRLGVRWYRAIEARLRDLSRDRARAILIAAAFPMLVRVALLPVLPVPLPYVHDEFSYLLLGDTLAHGRLANPAPPEWRHFETEYVLVRPTYASQYQPAQGLLLAAGQVVAGHPWWGVWTGMGVMCGALCWALSYMFPPAWALFGALMAALQFGIFGFWMNSYFGGAAAATGGALVVGSLLRMRARPASSGAICALGLVILLASRPFEGILWILLAATAAALQYRKNLPHVFLPAALVLALGIGSLAWYNFKVTGDPLDPPYATGRRTYGTPQSYWWQPPVVVKHFDNPQIEANYLNQLSYWKRRDSAAALWDSTWRRLRDFWRFFIGPFFAPALCFAGALWRDRKLRPWLLISVPFIAEHATYHAWYPQQSASETVLILILLVACWRRLRAWQRPRGWGLALSRSLIAGFVVAILMLSMGRAAQPYLPRKLAGGVRDLWCSLQPQPRMRDGVVARLEGLPGKHLVFVHYGTKHPYIDEWVFNPADIANARVVFSRLIDPASDLALVRKLGDRDVWMADPDAGTLERLDTPGLALLTRHDSPPPRM